MLILGLIGNCITIPLFGISQNIGMVRSRGIRVFVSDHFILRDCQRLSGFESPPVSCAVTLASFGKWLCSQIDATKPHSTPPREFLARPAPSSRVGPPMQQRDACL